LALNGIPFSNQVGIGHIQLNNINNITPKQNIEDEDSKVIGYTVCGALNQHSKPCKRIGHCPFHHRSNTLPNITIDKLDQNLIDTEVKLKNKNGSTNKNSDIGNVGVSRVITKKGPYKQGWTKEEHLKFLSGLQTHGKGAWKEISQLVGSRTPTQIQSHAQKYFLRQKQRLKAKRSIHDLSIDELISCEESEAILNSPNMIARSKSGYSSNITNTTYPTRILPNTPSVLNYQNGIANNAASYNDTTYHMMPYYGNWHDFPPYLGTTANGSLNNAASLNQAIPELPDFSGHVNDFFKQEPDEDEKKKKIYENQTFSRYNVNNQEYQNGMYTQ